MTSTEPTDPADPSDQKRDRLALAVDVFKATYIPLLIGVAAAVGLFGLWMYGVPKRPLALIAVVSLCAAPFVVTYSLLFAHRYHSRMQVPVVLLDRDHKKWGLKYLHPSEFAAAEIDGDELATRTARATGETVYFAESHQWEQRENVNPETGETETEAVRVLGSTWEAEISTLDFLEARKALKQQRDRLVPLAKESLEARAGADMKALENTDRLAHALLLGAEEDSFLAAGESDPFDFDVDARGSVDDLRPRTQQTDDTDDRAEKPSAGSYEIQESRQSIEDRLADLENGESHD